MSGRNGPELRIEMLGGFRVTAGCEVVEESAWRLRKARALVKLLALTRRDSLKERYLALLLSLATLSHEAGDEAAAIGALQDALVAEPLHELAHRELMRVYAVTGRRQRALAQFHLLREALRRDFED